MIETQSLQTYTMIHSIKVQRTPTCPKELMKKKDKTSFGNIFSIKNGIKFKKRDT